jgi:hypothetical protein
VSLKKAAITNYIFPKWTRPNTNILIENCRFVDGDVEVTDKASPWSRSLSIRPAYLWQFQTAIITGRNLVAYDDFLNKHYWKLRLYLTAALGFLIYQLWSKEDCTAEKRNGTKRCHEMTKQGRLKIFIFMVQDRASWKPTTISCAASRAKLCKDNHRIGYQASKSLQEDI